MTAEEVIQETAKLCRSFQAQKVILYGSRAKHTARAGSDIDIAVSGVKDFELLAERIEELPTLYSVDLLNNCTPHSRYVSDELGVQIFD